MKDKINVEIITIGDEILIGQIVDTNSAWMSVELNKVGFQVAQITSVHDQKQHILDSLQAALTHADIVLITGGIGPTKDDITKQTLCEFFHTKLIFNEEVYQNIERLFINRPYVMNELTRAQAMVPESSTVIQNKVGTAPLTWFEHQGKVIVSMPGVPFEMQNAMSTEIIPRLTTYYKTPVLLHKTMLVTGHPESALALKIAEWEDALPHYIQLAYLPNYAIVRLRLSGSGENAQELEAEMDSQVLKLKAILGDAIICDEDISVEKLINNLLKSQGKTLATAESCTGGNIAHLITSVAGSSACFKGSVVAYANEVKVNQLGVLEEDIQEYGAVSQCVVEQMAKGVLQLMKTDVAVATSGIMGPDGGSDDKPVGTIWIAACTSDRIISRKFNFSYKREQNIERSTQAALFMIREVLV